jgi:hypothetical protein
LSKYKNLAQYFFVVLPEPENKIKGSQDFSYFIILIKTINIIKRRAGKTIFL